MAKFIGEYSSKLDDKGRLVFPSAFKNVARQGDEAPQFVVKKDLFQPCLLIYTLQEWERQSEELYRQLQSNINFNREKSAFWRAYMRDRALVSPDEKTGRILIPKSLLNAIGAGREVVFAGNDLRIELWDKAAFEAASMSEEDYIALAEKLLS